MGRSNVSLLGASTLANSAERAGGAVLGSATLNVMGWEVTPREASMLLAAVVFIVLAGCVMYLFFQTNLGTAMRATAQDPVAAQLMGIPVERVIAVTFALGGALGGAGAVVYAIYINSLSFGMGYQIGLFAFTAAVLGGIGQIPGAVLGGLILGMVRSLGSAYIGEKWSSALIFAILITILIFRPAGLLGGSRREKV